MVEAILAWLGKQAASLGWRKAEEWLGRRAIKITTPLPRAVLMNPQSDGRVSYFAVQGSLKKLPQGHHIWLLVRPEQSDRVWPQGFFDVEFDPAIGQWTGRIHAEGASRFSIIAVVAPPTSCQFFRYYQRVGDKHDYQFEPLSQLPPECVNKDEVQVSLVPRST